MSDYLRTWWVWIVIIVIFLAAVYIYTRVTGKGIREGTPPDTSKTLTQVSGIRIDTITEESDLTPALPAGYREDRQYTETKQSKGEEECLRVVRKIFPHEFKVQQRYDFMRNPETGRCLELDISELTVLRLAIEYNGRQHYFFTKRFHNTIEDFHAQLRRDETKRQLCAEHGLYLIEVPYNVAIRDIERYILYSLPPTLEKYRRR